MALLSENYRNLLENAPVALVVLSSAGDLLDANVLAREMLGRDRDELVGRSFFGRIAEEPRAQDGASLLCTNCRRTGSFRLTRPDGTQVAGELSIAPAEVAGSRLFVARLQRHEPLDEDGFQQARKMEALGRLASGVAHDFNNLITAVICNSTLLLEKLPPGPQREEMLEIHRAGERAAALAKQLLAFSRRERPERRVVSLSAAADTMARMLRRIIGEDIQVVTILEPNIYPVEAPPGQIEQVVLNLAINARDAMPSGGKLIIETANVEIGESECRANPGGAPGSHALLTVTDTGIGMSPEVRSRLFEPFFTTKAEDRGTGIGLSTVREIVQQSGGRIEVRTQERRGTSFRIYFPRARVTGEEVRPPDPPPRPIGGSETILLMDRQESVRSPARRALRAHGYTVLEAQNGDEAVAILDGHPGPIHLLLTALRMTGRGERTPDRRFLARRANLKVLYMSAHGDPAAPRPDLQPAPVLQKPFTVDSLLRTVRQALER